MGVPNAREPRVSLARLARWWSTATQAEKLEAIKAAIRGDEQAPPLETLHIAALVAETAKAREGLGRRQTLHGASTRDAEVSRAGRPTVSVAAVLPRRR